MKPIHKLLHYFSYALLMLFMFSAMALEKSDTAGGNNKLQFIAYLDDQEIGYHHFEIINKADETVVLTQAEFGVRFMLIPVYSYEHKNREVWRNGCLLSLESETLDDGDPLYVSIKRIEGNTQIETQEKKTTNSSCIRSFAYWNPDLIKSNVLLNSQTGELINVSYTFVGHDKIQISNKSIDARQYQLKGKDSTGNDIDINLWYGNDDQWLSLESRLENNRYLRYKLEGETIQ